MTLHTFVLFLQHSELYTISCNWPCRVPREWKEEIFRELEASLGKLQEGLGYTSVLLDKNTCLEFPSAWVRSQPLPPPSHKTTYKPGENNTNSMSDKGPEARIFKELLQLSVNKTHNPIEK